MLTSLSASLKPIFSKWEKLRIPYNIILAGVLLLTHGLAMGNQFLQPFPLFVWLAGAILANFCFFAGPVTESYLSWLGLRSPWITLALFVTGVVLSIPLVILFPSALYFSEFSLG